MIRALQTYCKLKINSFFKKSNLNRYMVQKKWIKQRFRKSLQHRTIILCCWSVCYITPSILSIWQLNFRGYVKRLGESERNKKNPNKTKQNQKITNPFHTTLLLCRVVILLIFNLSCPLFVLILCHHLQFVPVHFTLINQPNTCTFLSENANVFTHSSS